MSSASHMRLVYELAQVDLRSEVERREDVECLLLKDAEIINSVTAGHTTQVCTALDMHLQQRVRDAGSHNLTCTYACAACVMRQDSDLVCCWSQRETFRHVDDTAAEPRDRSVNSSSGDNSRSFGSTAAGNGATPGVDDGADALDDPPAPQRPSLTVHHVALLEK